MPLGACTLLRRPELARAGLNFYASCLNSGWHALQRSQRSAAHTCATHVHALTHTRTHCTTCTCTRTAYFWCPRMHNTHARVHALPRASPLTRPCRRTYMAATPQEAPEEAPLPMGYDHMLSEFEKLCVLRCLRVDRITVGALGVHTRNCAPRWVRTPDMAPQHGCALHELRITLGECPHQEQRLVFLVPLTHPALSDGVTTPAAAAPPHHSGLPTLFLHAVP